MADDDIDPKILALVADAVARQIPAVGRREPVDVPPAITGAVADAMREIARRTVDEVLRDRRFLSESEIRAIAKEVASTITERIDREFKDDIRVFLTEQQIEDIVIDKLKDIGLKADKEHADETRETITGLFRGHRRRIEFGGAFAGELAKALVGYILAGAGVVAATYFSIKGFPPK